MLIINLINFTLSVPKAANAFKTACILSHLHYIYRRPLIKT